MLAHHGQKVAVEHLSAAVSTAAVGSPVAAAAVWVMVLLLQTFVTVPLLPLLPMVWAVAAAVEVVGCSVYQSLYLMHLLYAAEHRSRAPSAHGPTMGVKACQRPAADALPLLIIACFSSYLMDDGSL